MYLPLRAPDPGPPVQLCSLCTGWVNIQPTPCSLSWPFWCVELNLPWAGLPDLIDKNVGYSAKCKFQKDIKSFLSVSIALVVFELYLYSSFPLATLSLRKRKRLPFTHTRCWAFGGWGQDGCVHPYNCLFLIHWGGLFFSDTDANWCPHHNPVRERDA